MNNVYSVFRSPSLSEIIQAGEKSPALRTRSKCIGRLEGAILAWECIKKGKKIPTNDTYYEYIREELIRQSYYGKSIPDAVYDTPEQARRRGFVFVDGEPILRQLEYFTKLYVCKSDVYFGERISVPCTYMLIPHVMLQPSHREGQRNWRHFIPEAQPKNRTDDVSAATAEAHAKKIESRLLMDNYYAFSGAPVVNERGEVIQGNGRADALRIMFDRYPESTKDYLDTLRDWVIHNINEDKAGQWKISAQEGWPVLVRMVKCSDEEAIKLGRYTDSQITTGGSAIFDPDNVSQQLVCDKKMTTFSRIIFDAGDGNEDSDSSIRDFIRLNGNAALKWLCGHDYITSAEYNACIKTSEDGKQVTTKAIDALHQIFTSTLFRNTTNGFDVMFDSLSVRAQAAIFETITRDFSMPDGKKLIPLIREAVEVYYNLLRKFQGFKKARNVQQAKQEIWMWQNQSEMFAKDKFPADKYSTHAKLLAVLFKVSSQSQIRNVLNDIYDTMEGKGTPDMFSPDPFGVPQSMTDALNKVLGISLNGIDFLCESGYEMINKNKSYKYWPLHHTCPDFLDEARISDVFHRLIIPLTDALEEHQATERVRPPYADRRFSSCYDPISKFYNLTQYTPIDEKRVKVMFKDVIKKLAARKK